MSIFDDIKHGIQKVANAANDGVKKVTDAAAHAADTAVSKVQGAENSAVNAVKGAATSGVNAVKKAATDGVNTVKGAEHDVQSAIDKGVHDLEAKAQEGAHAVQSAVDDATHAVESAEDKAEQGVKDGLDAAVQSLKDETDKALDAVRAEAIKARDALEDAAKGSIDGIAKLGEELGEAEDKLWADIKSAVEHELTEEAMSKALHAAHTFVAWMKEKMDALAESKPNLVDKLNSISDSINLGPIVLGYANFYTRLDDLADALTKLTAEDIKLTQEFVIDAVTMLAPSTISIDADIEFLSRFGDDIKSIPIEIITEWLPDILDELGVPKDDGADDADTL